MVFSAYKKALDILLKKPFRLWGVSLLGGLLYSLACFFGVLPIIVIPIVLVLGFGMTAVFYRGSHGEEINSDLLFSGFKSFWKTAGAMGWQALWTFIWSPVPIMNIIKLYSYCFVPYYLITRPDLEATVALRTSMEETKGYRWKLFWASVIAPVIVAFGLGLLAALALIPYVGIFFDIILFLVSIVTILVFPLFMGLVQACMFDEVQNARVMEANRPKGKVCPGCGSSVPIDAKFCANCGFNFAQAPQYQQPYQQQYQPPVYAQQPYQPPVYPQQPYQQPSEGAPVTGNWGGNSGEYQPPQQG
ncbi:MAG TPA: zinc ribbon domain-containing protein [Clostridia bacterium]|nr:zinc ribbon domain-containing protein [Clostridia bacterium]